MEPFDEKAKYVKALGCGLPQPTEAPSQLPEGRHERGGDLPGTCVFPLSALRLVSSPYLEGPGTRLWCHRQPPPPPMPQADTCTSRLGYLITVRNRNS